MKISTFLTEYALAYIVRLQTHLKSVYVMKIWTPLFVEA